MPGFDNNVVYADNVDFSGGSPVTGKVVADGQILIGATAAPHLRVSTMTDVDGSITIANGAGTIGLSGTQATTTQKGSVTLADTSEALLASSTNKVIAPSTLNDVTSKLNFSGFANWAAGGPYFDDTTLGTFKLLVGGTGYIKSKQINWIAQDITGLTAGDTWYIYIDSAGTIGKTNTASLSLYTDNIVLFECLRDSTLVNNQITVKENHPYDYPTSISYGIHQTTGTVIENVLNGANIALNGTQKIQINGNDVLSDHGLYTDISDSGGIAVTFRKMYTNAGGKWATQNVSDTFGGFYNNAGTPTALGGSKFGVYTLYVSKESLNTATPSYFAVLHTAEFNNQTAANTAISNGTIARATNELAALELCQLGYIIYSQASNSIVQVTISKSTIRSAVSTSGTSTASLVNTTTTSFNGWLSATNTTVQSSLDTLDDVLIGGTSGQIVSSNGAATQPTYTTATFPKTTGSGEILLSNAANTVTSGASLTGDFTYTSSTAGSSRVLTVTNTDNSNTASHAVIKAVAGGTSGGDGKFQSIITGGQTWSLGGDNTDSDAFVLSANDALGTTNVIRSATSGILSYPLQSSVSAYKSANSTNVTGDNTLVTIVCNTEDYDVQGEYNTGSGVFTANTAGTYLVILSVYIANMSSGHTDCEIKILKNATSIKYNQFNPYASQTFGNYIYNCSVIAQLAATDTISATLKIQGSTKTVTLAGGADSTFIKIHKIA